MAQGLRYTCDGPGCGEEVGTREQPVVYIVIGSRENGELAADVKLPAFAWRILKGSVPRKDFCASCLAKELGLPLLTLDEHDKAEAGTRAGG